MTTRESAIDDILKENEVRSELLKANYDPITGIGAYGERTALEISDFAIPYQYVPVDMMKVKLIKRLKKYGSIKSFLESGEVNKEITSEDISTEIRKIRHKYDFQFWAYFQIHITSKTGEGRIRFKLNYAQIRVLDVCETLRKSGKPINLIICKARQWGGSTFCLFYQWWIALKWSESHCFSVCAQTQGVAASIVDMFSEALSQYAPWDLGLPTDSQLKLTPIPKTSEYVIKDQRGNKVRLNKVRIGSIESPDNLRGLAGSGAHFSEVAVYPDTAGKRSEDLVKAITGGILPRAYTMQVMESTPKGAGNYFHRQWLLSKDNRSGFSPVFIPWFYIPHDSLPIDDEREFAEWLYDGREDSDITVGKWKDSGKYYWRLWNLGASLEGINWYRYKRLEFDDFADMASEAPSDDIEAFQYSGTKVFSVYDIDVLRKDCRLPRKRGMLYSKGGKGKDVLADIRFVEDEKGELKIWCEPDKDPISNRYIVSVDVGGRGDKSDWSVIRVFDRSPMVVGGVPDLVAQMRYHTDYDLLAYDAMRIAKWYNNALLVIESNTLETRDQDRDTDGNMTEYILDILGNIYPNLYARTSSPDKVGSHPPRRWGFHTNASTKPALIGNLVECVREHLWIEKDPYCCDELALYEKNTRGQFSSPSGSGNHDDVLMCTAIALWVSYREMEAPRWTDEKTRTIHRVGADASIATF